MGRMFEHGPIRFGGMPKVLKVLMIANVVGFLLANLVPSGELLSHFGLVPVRVLKSLWVWQLFTYLFIHAGFFHILFNLFMLWMFGTPVAAQWGPREFLKYYLICGVGAGLLNVLLTPGSADPIIGASGAIYGLMVAFGLLFPDAVVYMYFLFPMKAWHMIALFAVIEFLAATSGRNPTVANFAHLGGMAIGYVYIRWWWTIRIRASAFWRVLTTRETSRKKPKGARRRAAKKPLRGPSAEDEMAEVDRILDKILAHGEESLTESEREILRRQAKKKPKGHA